MPGKQVDLLLTHLAKQTRDSLAPASRSSYSMNVIANWPMRKLCVRHMRSVLLAPISDPPFACIPRCGWRRRQPKWISFNLAKYLCIPHCHWFLFAPPIWGCDTPSLCVCVCARLIYEPYESKKSVTNFMTLFFHASSYILPFMPSSFATLTF